MGNELSPGRLWLWRQISLCTQGEFGLLRSQFSGADCCGINSSMFTIGNKIDSHLLNLLSGLPLYRYMLLGFRVMYLYYYGVLSGILSRPRFL